MKIADSKNLTALAASVVALLAVGATGCSDRTEQAASNAAQGAAQDAQNHAEAAGQAVQNAGQEVKEEVRQADQAVAGAAQQAGAEIKEEVREADEALGGAAKKAGAEIKEGVSEANEALGGVAQGAKDLGQAAALTPKIKNALVGADNIDATNINVETEGDKNAVMLEGSVKSQKEKDLATQVAKKALADAKSTFTLQNNLKVAK